MSLGRPYPPDAEVPASAAELVGLAEIGERLGKKRATVSNWSIRRGVSDFPEAIARPRMGPVYRWSDVEAWAKSKGYLE